VRRDRGGARWRWKQGSRVGLLRSLEQRIRAGWCAPCALVFKARQVAVASGHGRESARQHGVEEDGKRALPDFKFPMIFTHPNFEIQNDDLPDIQNSLNFAERQFEI
jgi:hypothetical protein